MENASPTKPVVILGFGAAGVSAVIALREEGYGGPLIVVTDADPTPYSPVLTSYYAGGRIKRDQCFIWSDLDLLALADEVRPHSRVSAIDAEAHEVALADGCRIGYSKLLIATGAHPVSPGFPAIDGFEPLVLRTMADADRLYRALASGTCANVLVSGTSMVGLKALEACLDRGVRATLLGRSQHVMRASAHPLVATRFEELLEARGVELRLSQSVASAIADGASGGCAITFDNGDTRRFDEVILAQGVKPNLDFADATLEVDRGLLVDRFMRTSSPDVYAAGDVAEALDVSTGKARIIGLWQNAVQQGRCAGRAIADELAGRAPSRPFPGSLPANTIHVRDILFASVGSLAGNANAEARFEISEEDGVLRVLAYEGDDATRHLVGVNLLAAASPEAKSDALDAEIGLYRRKILNAYLD